MTFAPWGSLLLLFDGIQSLLRVGRRWSPLAFSVALPPTHIRPTLHLNAFRGVRAISEFDWPFTPIHRSSESFSTLTSSALHAEIIGTSACPWIDHSVSRLSPLTSALLRLAFASLPHLKCLGCQWGITRRLIMQKARRYPNPKIKASTACKRMVSESFHSLS